MAKTMRQKFAKKTNAKAVNWLKTNGYEPPYTKARSLEDLPVFVKTYFKHHKPKNTNCEPELGEE